MYQMLQRTVTTSK